MCSSGGTVAAEDKELQAAQTAMTTTLNNDYNTTFAESQQTLGNLNAKLNYMAANPTGYTPTQFAAARTAINEQVASGAKSAISSAAAFAATHGGADTGSGPVGEIAGQIGSAAADTKAQELSSLSQQNEALKQSNFWKSIEGLSTVASEYGGSGGTALGGSSSLGNDAVNAGSGALAAQQAGWSDLGGVISGISGLATAASGFSGGGGAAHSPDMGAFTGSGVGTSNYDDEG